MADAETSVGGKPRPRQWLLRLFEHPNPWLPLVALAAWLAVGGWQESDSQTRNWAVLISSLSVAVLVPVRSSRRRRPPRRLLTTWLAWLLAAGLVFFTR